MGAIICCHEDVTAKKEGPTSPGGQGKDPPTQGSISHTNISCIVQAKRPMRINPSSVGSPSIIVQSRNLRDGGGILDVYP